MSLKLVKRDNGNVADDSDCYIAQTTSFSFQNRQFVISSSDIDDLSLIFDQLMNINFDESKVRRTVTFDVSVFQRSTNESGDV